MLMIVKECQKLQTPLDLIRNAEVRVLPSLSRVVPESGHAVSYGPFELPASLNFQFALTAM